MWPPHWPPHTAAARNAPGQGSVLSGVQSPGQSPGRGSRGRSLQKLRLFVNKCRNFDIFEGKINKTAKIQSSKLGSAEWRGEGQAQASPSLNTHLVL